jgi:hypothetical protein
MYLISVVTSLSSSVHSIIIIIDILKKTLVLKTLNLKAVQSAQECTVAELLEPHVILEQIPLLVSIFVKWSIYLLTYALF